MNNNWYKIKEECLDDLRQAWQAFSADQYLEDWFDRWFKPQTGTHGMHTGWEMRDKPKPGSALDSEDT